MSEETLLFTSVQKCDELCCIDCKITSLKVANEIVPSQFHCQILTCRRILSSFPKVIASPVSKTVDFIQVITTKDFFETNELQEFLANKNVSLSNPYPVTFEVYTVCVRYTIMFRLAPLWNKFGEYLCQGKNFLTCSEDPNAVTFDISIKSHGMFLKFKPSKLKLYPLKLEELGLSSSLLTEFNKNSKGVIHLGQHWANVLPSMTKARLLKVSKEIPKTCSFNNYQLLCKHWKNMYDYILPESSTGIIYYEVCFSGFPNDIFVYPNICLQSEYPKMIHCKSFAFTCIQFVEGLTNIVNTLCGKPLSLLKLNPNVIKHTPIPCFLSPRKKNSEKISFEIDEKPSFNEISNMKPKYENGNTISKLNTVQTLNLQKLSNTKSSLNVLSKPHQNSNLSNNLKNVNSSSKWKSPEIPTKIFPQYNQGIPIQRNKLTSDQTMENDDQSVNKSETLVRAIELIKSNETFSKKGDVKKRALIDDLLQKKIDIFAQTKRVRIFKKKGQDEPITKYFKVQKSNFGKTLQSEGSKLQIQNLKKNEVKTFQ